MIESKHVQPSVVETSAHNSYHICNVETLEPNGIQRLVYIAEALYFVEANLLNRIAHCVLPASKPVGGQPRWDISCQVENKNLSWICLGGVY